MRSAHPTLEIALGGARARLAFAIGGKQVFAVRVNQPAVEPSYLRSSLAEMADEIREEMTEAVVEAMR
jgi:hypothetical protein